MIHEVGFSFLTHTYNYSKIAILPEAVLFFNDRILFQNFKCRFGLD